VPDGLQNFRLIFAEPVNAGVGAVDVRHDAQPAKGKQVNTALCQRVDLDGGASAYNRKATESDGSD
jgi:hypothetical protein